jgi:hypothetical protein
MPTAATFGLELDTARQASLLRTIAFNDTQPRPAGGPFASSSADALALSRASSRLGTPAVSPRGSQAGTPRASIGGTPKPRPPPASATPSRAGSASRAMPPPSREPAPFASTPIVGAAPADDDAHLSPARRPGIPDKAYQYLADGDSQQPARTPQASARAPVRSVVSAPPRPFSSVEWEGTLRT